MNFGPLSPKFWGLNRDWSAGPPGDGGAVRPFGSTYVPANRDVSGLRREQQAFSSELARLDAENRWMAVPALAPVAAVAAAEGAGGLAAQMAARFGRPLRPGPLDFARREFPTGYHAAAKRGQEVHKAFKAYLESKPGWTAEQRVYNKERSRYVIPDGRGPPRSLPKAETHYQLELKPDTPSGHRAARAAEKRYKDFTGSRTRGVFYNPKTGQWRD